MARPVKQPGEQRSEVVRLRLTLAEAEHVRAQASAASQSVSEYLRRRAIGYTVPSPTTVRGDPALLSELNRIGVNVNQLAKSVHLDHKFVRHWEAIAGELRRVMELVARTQHDLDLDPELEAEPDLGAAS